MKKVTFENVAVKELSPALWNYKEDDEDRARSLEASLKNNGVIQNLVVYEAKNGKGKIVLDGNHRLSVLQKVGAEKVLVCNLGPISETRAKRIAMDINENKFPNDQFKLSKILQEISADPEEAEFLKDLPFSKRELKGLMSLETPGKGGGSGGDGDGGGGGGDSDLMMIKIAVDEDQAEAWLIWKKEIGTESDCVALMKALEYAIPARKKDIESDPDKT